MAASDRTRRYVREYDRAFRRLTENASEGFWISDPEFRTIYVNPAFGEIWGRPREQLYGDPETVLESIHPEDRERVERAIEGMIETGEFDEVYRVRRPDGSVRWVHDRGFPVRNDEGEVVDVAGIATDATDRKRVESELRRQRDHVEWLVETSPVMILAMDASRTITFANERAKEMAGVDDIAGTPFAEFPWELIEDGEALPPDRRPFAIIRERGEPAYGLEYRARIGGRERWLSINGAPLYEDGEFAGGVFATEDVTDRKRREESLSALHETSRGMMRADSKAAIHELAVSAAGDLLSFPGTASYRLVPDEYALRPAARGPEAGAFVEEGPIDDGPIWEAFVEGEVVEGAGLTAIGLGAHGALALPEGELDDESRSLMGVLCHNAEAALDRTDREDVLRTQSEALRRTNDELERLDHVVDLVRDVTGALIRAGSRAEVATTVCERLAAADQYRFAWIGDERGEPTAWAGVTESALAGIERPGSGYEPPAERALRTGELAVERGLLEAGHPDRRADALSCNYRSVAAVPLEHRDREYGVLSVYADRDDAFGRDERGVLSELGGTIAHAIDALEARAALASDGVTELRFSIRDPSAITAELAGGAELEHRGTVPQEDGSVRWFVAVDAPPERVERAATGIDRIGDVRTITAEAPTLLDCVVNPPWLLSPFLERGATVTSLAVSGGTTTVVAEAGSETDVRSLREALDSRYAAVELTGRRDLDRPPRTREERRSSIQGGLTDRQREILRVAHASGYFETPRRTTGAELAERLDINRSTFHRTLRAAEQTTFDALLE